MWKYEETDNFVFVPWLDLSKIRFWEKKNRLLSWFNMRESTRIIIGNILTLPSSLHISYKYFSLLHDSKNVYRCTTTVKRFALVKLSHNFVFGLHSSDKAQQYKSITIKCFIFDPTLFCQILVWWILKIL